jgi:hypothetical protein
MRQALALFALLAPLALATPARADVPPPNTAGCTNKKAGDACKDDAGKDATCADAKCTVLDYSDGSPPGSKEVDCVTCTGPASSSSSSSSGGSSGGNEDDGGCTIRGNAAAGAAGAWAIAAAVLLLFRKARPRSEKRSRRP